MSTFWIITNLLGIGVLAGLMKVFEKAGYKQWYALIPLYNIYIWLKVIEKPQWWWVFIIIPFINVFMLLLMLVETAKTFNKNFLWQQGLAAIVPFVYIPLLGFKEDEKYQKKEDRPPFHKTKVREWTDAIIFAIVAASIIRMFIFEAYTIPTPSMERSMMVGDYLFVSKFHYGPKRPNTPLALPFMHHSIPLTKAKKSYLEWIHLPYKRYQGLTDVKHNDIVVFNYPDGDTVDLNNQDMSYYQIVRDLGWKNANSKGYVFNTGNPRVIGEVTARPVDKRENYVKRCIGLPGDTLQIIDQEVYINGSKAETPELIQHNYFIVGKDKTLTKQEFENYGISIADYNEYYQSLFDQQWHMTYTQLYLPNSTAKGQITQEELPRTGYINLDEATAEELRNHPQVLKLIKHVRSADLPSLGNHTFPHNQSMFPWNVDNYGPFYLPKKGDQIELTEANKIFYRRAIEVYEGNAIEIKDGDFYLNGEKLSHYTFKMDYYWMMGDNRHNSADSRMWGYVPEDHIVGKAAFIWMSVDRDYGGIRWDRIFKIPE
jgi:signal peptidase I